MFSGRWREMSQYPELREAEVSAFADLQHMVHGALGRKDDAEESAIRPAAVAAWATVHGVATLLVDGRIDLPPGSDPQEAAERLTLDVTTVLGRGLRSL